MIIWAKKYFCDVYYYSNTNDLISEISRIFSLNIFEYYFNIYMLSTTILPVKLLRFNQRNDSVVKRTGWFWRSAEINSQHPHDASQPAV